MRIITRREWGARPPKHVGTPLNKGLVEGVVIHHTETSCCGVDTSEFSTVSAALRSIQQFHMDTRGWNDIAYNFAVDQRGAIYECRGWYVESAANGTSSTNDRYPAIVAMGSFDSTTPTEKMLNSMAYLVAEFRKLYSAGTKVLGHRDVRSTSCPGTRLYSRVGEINKRATGNITVPVHPVLRRGDTGEWVVRLQSELNVVASTKLAPDGIFGQATQAAVNNFNQLLRGFWKRTDVPNLNEVGETTWWFLDLFYLLKTGKHP